MRSVPAGWMLTISVVLLVLVSVARSWTALLAMTAVIVVLMIWTKASVRALLNALRSAVPLFAIAGFLHLIFRVWFIDSEVGASLGTHLLNTAFFMVRLLLFVLLPAALLAAHSAAAYAEAAVSGIGRVTGWTAAKQVGQISHLAFSMLPELRDFAAQRKLSRELRGIGAPKSLSGKARFVRAEFFSVIQHALQLSQTVAIVLWSRGYLESHKQVVPQLDETPQPAVAPQR